MFYPKYYGDNILKEDDMPKDDDLIIDFLLKKNKTRDLVSMRGFTTKSRWILFYHIT